MRFFISKLILSMLVFVLISVQNFNSQAFAYTDCHAGVKGQCVENDEYPCPLDTECRGESAGNPPHKVCGCYSIKNAKPNYEQTPSVKSSFPIHSNSLSRIKSSAIADITTLAVPSTIKVKGNILLHFVQLSDTHLQKPSVKASHGKLLHDSEVLLSTAVKQINKIKNLDFVLVTGDLVDVPDEKLVDKYIEITMSLKYPTYSLLGNHDVSGTGIDKSAFIKKFYQLANPTSFANHMSYYSFSPKDKFVVICLDGAIDRIDTAHGQIDNKQLKWLKDELEANKDKYVIVAYHFPLYPPYVSKERTVLERDRNKLIKLINNYKNVIGVFTGHYHAAGIFFVKDKVHEAAPALVQYPNAFREIIISQEEPEHIKVNFIWHEVDNPVLVQKSKHTTHTWRIFQGSLKDRENIFEFKAL